MKRKKRAGKVARLGDALLLVAGFGILFLLIRSVYHFLMPLFL
ncbi:hypothetical protein [Leisingera sp. ANG59]|nr:hypothetical protein [Leisingera sp. ANG59]